MYVVSHSLILILPAAICFLMHSGHRPHRWRSIRGQVPQGRSEQRYVSDNAVVGFQADNKFRIKGNGPSPK